jgi:hypothetical protein
VTRGRALGFARSVARGFLGEDLEDLVEDRPAPAAICASAARASDRGARARTAVNQVAYLMLADGFALADDHRLEATIHPRILNSNVNVVTGATVTSGARPNHPLPP